MPDKGVKRQAMVASRAYLDHNASAPLLPAARIAMVDALEVAANPSSVHAEGRAARRMIEEARRDVAALVNGRPEQVVFTSGATEAASTLLTPDWRMGRAPLRMARLYVSAADHPCLLGGGRFPADRVSRIGVDGGGIVDFGALATALAAHDRADGLPLVAIHAANNETGVIQPLAEIAVMVRNAGGVLVVDAVQAAGRIPLDVSGACGDFLILSSHKIGGPKGVGAFIGNADVMMPAPLVSGGGQEKGHRAGTENLAGIAGFGAAAREALAGLAGMAAVAALRDRFEQVIRGLAPDAEIHGAGAQRLANTSFFSVPGLKAETAQIAFDLAGIALSAGSACSSGKVGPSHVLQAMGKADRQGALRLSIGRDTSEEALKLFSDAFASLLARRSGAPKAA